MEVVQIQLAIPDQEVFRLVGLGSFLELHDGEPALGLHLGEQLQVSHDQLPQLLIKIMMLLARTMKQ